VSYEAAGPEYPASPLGVRVDRRSLPAQENLCRPSIEWGIDLPIALRPPGPTCQPFGCPRDARLVGIEIGFGQKISDIVCVDQHRMGAQMPALAQQIVDFCSIGI
jgi:hypothetical protein